MTTHASPALLALAALALTGCAAPTQAPNQAPNDAPNAATETRQPAEPDRAQAGAGARPIVRPAERSTPRLDPAMRSEGATALANPAPPVNAAIPPTTPDQWQPDWYTGAVTTEDGTRVGSAVATHRNLLEARRLAVAAAFDMLDAGTIDQTVTRQLDDGRFRVWVRIAAGS